MRLAGKCKRLRRNYKNKFYQRLILRYKNQLFFYYYNFWFLFIQFCKYGQLISNIWKTINKFKDVNPKAANTINIGQNCRNSGGGNRQKRGFLTLIVTIGKTGEAKTINTGNLIIKEIDNYISKYLYFIYGKERYYTFACFNNPKSLQ